MKLISATVLLLCTHIAFSDIANPAEWDNRFYMFPGPDTASGNGGAPAPVAPYPGGGFLVSGMFTNLAGTPVLNLARWDGAKWVKPLAGQANADDTTGDIQIAFKSVIDTSNGIYSIAAFQPSTNAPVELLIGGWALTNAGGATIQNVAWWTGTNWNDLNLGTTGRVASVIFDDTGDKYVAGHFESIGGVDATNVAHFNGTAWEALGSGLPFAADVIARHDGALYAAGYAPAGGTASHALLRWNGSEWFPVADAFDKSSNPHVLSLLSTDAGLYVAGSFTNIGSVTATNIALWTGSEWRALGSGISGRITSLAEHNGDILAARLGFQSALVNGYSGLARWDGTNWSLESQAPAVRAKTVAVNGETILTRGQIDNGLDAPPRGVAYFDGVDWLPIGQGLYESLLYVENIRTIHLIPHQQDLVFTATYPMISRGQIRRWNGEIWSSIGRSLPSPVRINSIQSQGELLWVSTPTLGWVTPAGTRIAATDGTNWHAVTQAFTPNSIAVLGGKVFAGGNSGLYQWNGFSYAKIESVTNVVSSLATDGNALFLATLPSAGSRFFSVKSLENGILREIAPPVTNFSTRFDVAYLNGALYAYGEFTNFVGKPINSVARWDGQEWHAVIPSTIRMSARTLAGDGRNTLFVGGLSLLNGTNLLQVRDGIVTGLKAGRNVDTIEAARWWRGALYVAGPFTTVAGVRSEVIGAWHDPEAAVEVIVQAPTNTLAGSTATLNLGVVNVRATNVQNVVLTLPLAPGAEPVNLPANATVQGTNLVLQFASLPSGMTNIPLRLNLNGSEGTNFVFQVFASGDSFPTFRSDPAATTISIGNLPPLITLGTIPQSVTIPAAALLTAIASDSDGSITNVEFYANGQLIGSDSEAPYEFSWSPTIVGTHVITSAAYDNGGSKTVSLPRNLLVLARPANDSFENRIILTNANGTFSGTLVEATSDPGDPAGFGGTVWYEWQPNSNGIADIVIVPTYLKIAVFRDGTNQPPVAFSESSTTLPIRLVVHENDRFIFVIGGNTGNFELQLKITALQPHDFFANAKPLEGWEFGLELDHFGLTSEPGEPSIDGVAPQGTLWFSWTAPADGRVVLVLSGIRLGFYRGTNLTTLERIAPTLKDRGWGDYPVTAGTKYYLQTDAVFARFGGSFAFDFVTQGGRIRSFSQEPSGNWKFDFRSFDYSEYVVERSTDLVNWEPVHTFTTSAQSSQFTIPVEPTTERSVFWRTRYSRPAP
ncbi:MAG TPA: Ig-like domain-containing protein [Verrucomicrobiae bacterium]